MKKHEDCIRVRGKGIKGKKRNFSKFFLYMEKAEKKGTGCFFLGGHQGGKRGIEEEKKKKKKGGGTLFSNDCKRGREKEGSGIFPHDPTKETRRRGKKEKGEEKPAGSFPFVGGGRKDGWALALTGTKQKKNQKKKKKKGREGEKSTGSQFASGRQIENAKNTPGFVGARWWKKEEKKKKRGKNIVQRNAIG